MILRTSLAVAGIALLAGCAGGGGVESPFAGDSGSRQAQLAAYAASTPYPSTQATPATHLGAIVNRDDKTLRILNFSDQQVKDGRVWINGAFVHRIQSVPPHSSVTLRLDQFYNNTGRSMKDMSITPENVQLQADGNLYSLQGPLFEK